MKRFRTSLLLLGSLALASLPSQAAPAEGCATVSVSTSPATVTAGYGVGIYGSINNCSSRRERYTVVVSAMSDCGQSTPIASFRMTFKPGENRMYGVSHTTTPNTCTGPCSVTVEVHDGGGVIARSEGTFSVMN